MGAFLPRLGPLVPPAGGPSFPPSPTPAKNPFHIEVDDRAAAKTVNVVEAQWDPRFGARIQRFVARDVDRWSCRFAGIAPPPTRRSTPLLAFPRRLSSASNPVMNWGQSCRLRWQKSAAGSWNAGDDDRHPE